MSMPSITEECECNASARIHEMECELTGLRAERSAHMEEISHLRRALAGLQRHLEQSTQISLNSSARVERAVEDFKQLLQVF